MKRISGITYLKAFLPLLVIACHARPFGESLYSVTPLPNSPSFNDSLFVNVFSLAVPIFFIISLYLYLKKRSRSENVGSVFKARIIYLAVLFLVVRGIYLIFGIGNLWVSKRGMVRNVYHLVFGGGDTLLYYLEALIFLIILLEIVIRVFSKLNIQKTKIYCIFAAVLTVLIIAFYFVPFASLKVEALRFFSPICFLPYVFIALIFDKLKDKPKIWQLSALLGLGIISAIIEWRFLPDTLFLQSGYQVALSLYGRPSVVLISAVIFGFSLYITEKPSKVIEFMAAISLDVYLTHQIVIKYVYGEVSNPAVGYLLVTVITYALSAVIYFVKNYLKKLKNNRISEETK
ncbi:MAG: acyltransferase [Clostridia bacterium]|nr:acyltransferase [Clostridia bacterium]